MPTLQSMAYQNVTLLPSHWQQQFLEITRFLLNLDTDKLLHNFRKGAGQAAPGVTYFGWYGEGATTFGQWIGAMAKGYSVTGDRRLYDKMSMLLHGWADTIGPNGYTKFSKEHESTYAFEKLVGGLVDAIEYADFAPARQMLAQITAWAEKTFDQGIPRGYLTYLELLGIKMHEWYTFSENYYRAYRLTGEKQYLTFAKTWEYTVFWEDMIEGNEVLPPRHAYSHVNSLSGAAQAYAVHGDEKYLRAMESAHDIIVSRHMYATGGYGPAESLFGKPGYLGDALLGMKGQSRHGSRFVDLDGHGVCDDLYGSCEVSCCAWAVFKLTDYLLQYTGNARYAQWAERLLINGTGAQLPLTDEGKVMYFANYFSCGASKQVEDRRAGLDGETNTWQCCTGTFPQAVTAYHNLIFYTDPDGVSISQYIPAEGTFVIGDSALSLRITSDFPQDGAVGIDVCPQADALDCAIRLRIPEWAQGASVAINGLPAETGLTPGDWHVLHRTWRPGDHITLHLPYALRFETVDAAHPHLAALCYGPVVLAMTEIAILQGDMAHPEAWIHPLPGRPLCFETEPGHDLRFAERTHEFTPFYQLGLGTWYYMYMEVRPQP